LLASARRHALRGMRARATELEHDDAALQLGTMLEHLAKAYLASLHPTLLIDSKQFDFSSLLRLASQGQRVKPGHVLKTVGMRDALVRIGSIQAPSHGSAGADFAKRFDPLLQARNGVAHIGHDGGRADEVAQLAVQGAQAILAMMGRPLEELFGDYTAAAEALLSEHGTKVHQLVTLKVASAKRSFDERYADLDPQQRASELEARDRMTTISLAEEHDRLATTCPACQRTGILSGSAELDWETVEIEVDGVIQPFVGIGEARAVLFADAYRCPVCGLRLQGREQLVEARLQIEVSLGPAFVETLEAIYAERDAELEPGEEPDQ
jgi:hypothetical protein